MAIRQCPWVVCHPLRWRPEPRELKASGAAGKVKMMSWVREFQERLARAAVDIMTHELYLYLPYIDDNNLVMEELPPGTRLEGDKFVVREDLVKEDEKIKGDKRTALLVKELTNKICYFLQMEVDYPSKNLSGWMPLLNLKVRMAKDKSVDLMWYRKPVASPYTILNRSALPPSVKRISLVQYGLTMLLNTRSELQEEKRGWLMEELAEMMMVSGYNEDFRRGIIESVVRGYEGKVAASDRGEVRT